MTNESALEVGHAKVIAWMLDGKSNAEVAALTGVSRQAVYKFRQRHASELKPRENQIINAHLRDKEERINKLNWMAEGIETELVNRGFMWLEPFGAEREVLKMPTGAIREYRETLRQIAEEMGQIPRPSDQAVNVNVGVAIALKWNDGSDVNA